MTLFTTLITLFLDRIIHIVDKIANSKAGSVLNRCSIQFEVSWLQRLVDATRIVCCCHFLQAGFVVRTLSRNDLLELTAIVHIDVLMGNPTLFCFVSDDFVVIVNESVDSIVISSVIPPKGHVE